MVLNHEFLNFAQASRYLKLSRLQLKKLLESGEIRGQKRGRTWQVDPVSVEEWSNLQEIKSQLNTAITGIRAKSVAPRRARSILDAARLYLDCMDIGQQQGQQQLQLAMLVDELAHLLATKG
ncbi:MAG: helix-turn-helix domain-containing protein [Deltaproteobacteria bacterium]|nr:helix-turn-helix domain-containing protein [Deltaproteobacteria bacterium]MBW2306019.1 helix-turn-helix domain-containing protein [Deltaproteobacteria bacterium]